MPHTYKLAQFLCVGLLFVVGLATANDVGATVEIEAVVPGVCGNGIKEIGEQCDGGDLGGSSCSTVGYATGTISCSASCSYDVSACSNPTPPPVISRSSGRALSPGRTVDEDNEEITRVLFEGIGYPNTSVALHLGGEELQTARTDDQGEFSITTYDLSPGFLTFSAVIESDTGQSVRSKPVTILLRSGEVARISGAVLPPLVNKRVKREQDELMISGHAVPDTPINLVVSGDISDQFIVRSSSEGRWEGNVQVPGDDLNTVELQASMLYDGEQYWSEVVYPDISADFDSGTQGGDSLPPDVNRDNRVNMVDFYILKFWLDRPELSPPDVVDVNNDGVVNYADFSIMAYYWTG